jgi:hypothetical protein
MFLVVDHIQPESRGGRTVADNLQTLCRACNSRKLHHLTEFIEPGRACESSECWCRQPVEVQPEVSLFTTEEARTADRLRIVKKLPAGGPKKPAGYFVRYLRVERARDGLFWERRTRELCPWRAA